MENMPNSKSSPGIVVSGLDAGDDIDTPFCQQSINELSRAAKERLLKFQQIRGNGSSSSSSSMR